MLQKYHSTVRLARIQPIKKPVTLKERILNGTKETGNWMVVGAGLALLGGSLFAVMKHALGYDQPFDPLFQQASELVVKNEKVKALLGPSVRTGYGHPRSRQREITSFESLNEVTIEFWAGTKEKDARIIARAYKRPKGLQLYLVQMVEPKVTIYFRKVKPFSNLMSKFRKPA